MLEVLVESGVARPRRSSWTAVSVITHALVVALAVYATVKPAAVASGRDDPVEDVFYVPVTPVDAATSPVDQTSMPTPTSAYTFSMPKFDVPSIALPGPDFLDRVVDDIRAMSVGSIVGTRGSTPSAGGVHTAENVDRMVAPLPGNSSPLYPARLAAAGIEGDVVARFVVDTAGRVEARSVHIIEASHALFGESVTQWLRQTRYSPALVNGRPVRQLVQQRVGFSLTR